MYRVNKRVLSTSQYGVSEWLQSWDFSPIRLWRRAEAALPTLQAIRLSSTSEMATVRVASGFSLFTIRTSTLKAKEAACFLQFLGLPGRSSCVLAALALAIARLLDQEASQFIGFAIGCR